MTADRPLAPCPSAARRPLSRRWLAPLMCAVIALTSATPAFAQDEDEMPDARIAGYTEKIGIGGSSTFTYVLAAFLGLISVGITFKNSRRTHLD
jgi:hypothetical protein